MLESIKQHVKKPGRMSDSWSGASSICRTSGWRFSPVGPGRRQMVLATQATRLLRAGGGGGGRRSLARAGEAFGHRGNCKD